MQGLCCRLAIWEPSVAVAAIHPTLPSPPADAVEGHLSFLAVAPCCWVMLGLLTAETPRLSKALAELGFPHLVFVQLFSWTQVQDLTFILSKDSKASISQKWNSWVMENILLRSASWKQRESQENKPGGINSGKKQTSQVHPEVSTCTFTGVSWRLHNFLNFFFFGVWDRISPYNSPGYLGTHYIPG